MIALRALLNDRKRSQRGSVLSAVLIIVAFISIIAGAMMTELSTNFLLSRNLVNRVNNEATVNSAMEMSMDSIQNAPLTGGCPVLSPVTLNGRTAAVSYVSCAPVVDVRSPQFVPMPGTAAFTTDGSHSIIPTAGQDVYTVGDSAGMVYQYAFGSSSLNWLYNVGSDVTGPPLAMQDFGLSPPDPQDVTNLVPIEGGDSSGCTFNACVEFLSWDTNSSSVDSPCFMKANANVTSQPAPGLLYPKNTYFGDTAGTLWAYDATEAGKCALNGSATAPGSPAIVAGPIVFGHSGDEEIYVVTDGGGTPQLVRFTYEPGDSPALAFVEAVNLPYAGPKGIALEKSTVPARLAITFAGGQVAIANISGSYHPSVLLSGAVAGGATNAPSWCSCSNGPLIGVGGTNGTLYVLDPLLNLVASYAGGSPIRTTPASDGIGEWYYGADDRYLYEVQQIPGQSSLVLIKPYGPFGGAVRSSAQVGPCTAGICVYMGSLDGNAYVVPLDARDAVITACLSSSPPACSGDNPRLWAQVEVGSGASPRTVHVRGWSYYSP